MHRYLRILQSSFALKRIPSAKLGGAISCSLNSSGVTRGKTTRFACIIRKSARDLRAADKTFLRHREQIRAQDEKDLSRPHEIKAV